MFGKTKTLLMAGLLVSGSAVAGEVSLKQVTDFYIAEASSATAMEVQNAVYSDILNRAHKLEIEPLNIKTKILISSVQKTEKSDSETSE